MMIEQKSPLLWTQNGNPEIPPDQPVEVPPQDVPPEVPAGDWPEMPESPESPQIEPATRPDEIPQNGD
jgi:hypothetical protein